MNIPINSVHRRLRQPVVPAYAGPPPMFNQYPEQQQLQQQLRHIPRLSNNSCYPYGQPPYASTLWPSDQRSMGGALSHGPISRHSAHQQQHYRYPQSILRRKRQPNYGSTPPAVDSNGQVYGMAPGAVQHDGGGRSTYRRGGIPYFYDE